MKKEKEKLTPQSDLSVKWRWKQRCLQFPAKQLQWWRSHYIQIYKIYNAPYMSIRKRIWSAAMASER